MGPLIYLLRNNFQINPFRVLNDAKIDQRFWYEREEGFTVADSY